MQRKIWQTFKLFDKHNSEGVLLIFNAIFSVIILGEKITKNTVLGLGAIILGIFLIYCDYFKITLF